MNLRFFLGFVWGGRQKCRWIVICLLWCVLIVDGGWGKGRKQPIDEGPVRPKNIRVLLEEKPADKEVIFDISSKDGFVLESPVGSGVTALLSDSAIKIRVNDKKLYIKYQGKPYQKLKHNNIEICSARNKLHVNDKTYQGNLTLCLDSQKNLLLLINKLDLEDYVYSVLRYESVPSWPQEMQKVQAIASRTYALYHMKQSRTRNPKLPYDIRNTNHNQLYNGTHEQTHLRAAVDETKNLVLTYHGNVALTMFDICCGGITPALMSSRDTSKPYLCRSQPCVYCKNANDYVWKERCSCRDFMGQFKTNPKIGAKVQMLGPKLVDVKVVERDRAGVARRVRLIGKHDITLTGREFKSILPGKIKSTAFSLKKEHDKIIIVGHGNSHFNGLCQWGARELVSRGWNYRKVLNFYYPGTNLSRLV